MHAKVSTEALGQPSIATLHAQWQLAYDNSKYRRYTHRQVNE